MKVLGLAGGNKKKAAKLLGVDPTTIWRKMQ
jgi:transcriptional regulator with PAS, ATPase and Fis domain